MHNQKLNFTLDHRLSIGQIRSKENWSFYRKKRNPAGRAWTAVSFNEVRL